MTVGNRMTWWKPHDDGELHDVETTHDVKTTYALSLHGRISPDLGDAMTFLKATGRFYLLCLYVIPKLFIPLH